MGKSRMKRSARFFLARHKGRFARVRLELAGELPASLYRLGDVIYLDVRVTNVGEGEIGSSAGKSWWEGWDNQDFLSYHWSASGKRQKWEPRRTPFAEPLAPGESAVVRLTVVVSARESDAVLEVDMVREGEFWYAEVGDRALRLPISCLPPEETEHPVPPGELMYAVGGTTELAWFIGSGHLAASSMRDILAKNGIDIEEPRAILDFGCGTGRVLHHLRHLKGAALYGTDYNPDLISWCRDNLRFAAFQTNPPTGRLSYADGQFDLIYAFSVFTHLTEEQQMFWIDELNRVLKAGGYLLFSVHGESAYFKLLSEEEQQRFKRGQLIVQSDEQAGTNVCGAFHPEAYIRERMAKDFIFLDYVPEGALGNPWQDVVLLKKPA
jgi:SAM-dependent methyltransferase